MAASPTTSPESILVVRLGAMGDVLHAMPSVAALRRKFPDAKLGWVIERRWAELLLSGDGATATVSGNSLVDSLHVVDTLAWRKHLLAGSTRHEVGRVLKKLRSPKYEMAIDIQGAIKSALIAKLSGVKTVYGFEAPREHLATMFYQYRIATNAAHVVEQNLELCSALARDRLSSGNYDLPRSAQAERWCDRTLGEQGLKRFAILNPGSGWGAKCWPGERFAEVARRLNVSGIRSVINFGPGEETLSNAVAKQSENAALPMSCSITELISLTRRAVLFVGGDTGPMHLAAALKIPVVALFGPTDPARNGPYGTEALVLRSQRSVTSYSHVADADPGLHSITTDEVITAASRLLGVSIG